MNLKNQNILFIVRTMGVGGTENVVLQLCQVFHNLVNKIVVCSTGGVLENELNRMGIQHYKIKDISSKNPLDFISSCFEIREIIKKEKITVVHSHHRMAALMAEIVSPSSVIKVTNAHNTFYDKRFLTRFAYKHTHIVAVGKKVKQNLIDYFGLPEKQISVIYNAVKPFDKKIDVLDVLKNEKQQGNVVIGNIGRLAPQKGMEYFIEAAKLVLKKLPNARFFIVGDGPLKDKLQQMIRQYHLEKFVHMLGYRADIQNVMSQCDFIVLSSLWEGLPLTPIEAFSVSKTLVATSVDGTPEIVKNNINGLLVEPNNVEQLADKICYLIENKDYRKKLELSAKSTFDEQFSFAKLNENYVQYYISLPITIP